MSSSSVKVGDQLPEKIYPLTRQDLVNYAGVSGDLNPIHWDDEIAKVVGLDTVIAHGMLTMGLGGGFVTSWVGDPGAVTEYNVRFTAVVPVPNDGKGAEIVFSGRVKSVDPDSKSVTIAHYGDHRRQEDLRPCYRIGEVGVAVAINTDILGMVWDYPDSFVVGREKVREFAKSVKADDPACFDEDAAAELGYDGLVAPPTFVTILGKMVQADFMRKVDTGYETLQMVQVDQRFVFHKPILAGDVLHARMEVHSVAERFGADIVVTRNTLTNQHGEVVMEAYTTVMGHEGDNSINLKWDMETGQVVRTA